MDKRGFWINDPDTGTRVRVGAVGYNLSEMLTKQRQPRLAREALSKPHVGFTIEKKF